MVIGMRRDVTRIISNGLAAAAACGALVWAYSLLDHFEQRKSDHLREQCLALGGTFNPGDRPVLLRTATGKPPTCIH